MEELLINPDFVLQKLEYIHHNPVKAKLVDRPEAYVFSSAADYYGKQGLLPLTLLESGYNLKK